MIQSLLRQLIQATDSNIEDEKVEIKTGEDDDDDS